MVYSITDDESFDFISRVADFLQEFKFQNQIIIVGTKVDLM